MNCLGRKLTKPPSRATNLAVVTVVLLASLLTAAVEGQGSGVLSS